MRLHKTSSNRLPETWFRRGLWLIAVVFAAFLIGLGGKVVGDLPQVEQYQPLRHYVDQSRYPQTEQALRDLAQQQQKTTDALAQAELALSRQNSQIASAQESLSNWLATRSATEQNAQNPEVIRRTQAIDRLKETADEQQRQVDALHQQQLDQNQRQAALERDIGQMEAVAQSAKDAADRQTELQVFLYRLAMTLPLLGVAGYLFARQRQSKWWPFVWGFIYFALFTFFVELVPYLPSYGGYVRYLVGIVITILVGRYAIVAMNRYLERKRAEEALPTRERQQQVGYDKAQQSLAKGICPGCERPLDFSNPDMDYCPHCSLRLFNQCGHCHTRKSAFHHYCYRCGTPADAPDAAD